VRNIQAFCEVVRSGDSVDDLYGRYMGELATLAASLPFVHLMLGGSGGL